MKEVNNQRLHYATTLGCILIQLRMRIMFLQLKDATKQGT